MGRRKQPDRQVKKKLEIEMPEDLNITKRKRKLEEARVEAKFKMATLAPRKQPDRQAKKKRKIEIPDDLDVKKRKLKLEVEEPGVEEKFKMATLAPRKQPDRKVKKKGKIEIPVRNFVIEGVACQPPSS